MVFLRPPLGEGQGFWRSTTTKSGALNAKTACHRLGTRLIQASLVDAGGAVAPDGPTVIQRRLIARSSIMPPSLASDWRSGSFGER